jgi:lysyl-tRNA synthetase class 2
LDDGPQTPRAAGGLDAGSAAGASQHLAALPWADYTVDALMREYAGLPGGWAEDEDILRAAAGDIDPGREDFESLFNRLLVHYVEPRLPREGAVLLRDYPAGVPTLARKRGNSPWSERWELYLFGLEVANCYTEETDPEQVRAFFDSERRKKQSSVITHRIDAAYPAIFADVRDEVSGVAVGMDRLLMGLLGAEEIEEVLVFPAGSMIY